MLARLAIIAAVLVPLAAIAPAASAAPLDQHHTAGVHVTHHGHGVGHPWVGVRSWGRGPVVVGVPFLPPPVVALPPPAFAPVAVPYAVPVPVAQPVAVPVAAPLPVSVPYAPPQVTYPALPVSAPCGCPPSQ